MKNFTKQFANKALFKPTRWLLVALMFLLGTASAWAYNQSAVDLYFDDSEAKWSDNSKSPYVYIGHSTWTACYGPFTRVSGTQYLFKLAKANFNNGGTWNGASAWVICNEKWWDTSGESIDKFTWHGDKNVTQKRTSAWSASYIYKTNGTASTTSDNHTIQAYKTTTVSNSNYTVTINSATGGTLTVKDYDNNAVSNGASKIYLTVLKFSASASSGYTLKEVQINDGSTTTTIAAANLGSTTYTLKSAVTITPVWEKTCTPPAAPTLNPNSTTVCSGTSFDLPSGYRWYTVATGGTKLASNTISAGITQKTIYYAEAGEDGCVSTSRTAYTVNVDAKPAITLKSAPTICNGTTVTFANYVNTHTGTVTWHTKSDFSDAAITSAKPNATTTYYAKATNGVCSTPATASLKVTVSPKPAITLKAAPTICNGTTVTFANYVDTHTGTVTWHTKSDFSDAAITSAKPSQTTTYYAKASSGDCTPATASLKVTVNDKPLVPTLSADNTSLIDGDKAVFTVGNTVAGLTYTLYNGNTPGKSQVSNGSGLTFKAGDAGSYTVKVTNTCGTSTSTPAVVITVCTPQTNEFRHANSSYTQLANQPTYYPGDKAYFVSTGNCCLTGTWSNNLQKGEEAWWTGLSESTPKFSMTLTRAGEFTITNMATNGCTQDKNVRVDLDFTVTALSQVTNANGTASGADIALTWKHSANHTKVMVVRYPTAGTETIPAGGQSYSAGNTLGGGTVVYVGTAESYTDQDLSAGASYKYYFYTVNNNYYSEGVVLNMSSCPTPAKPQLESTAVTTCNGNVTTFGYITITNIVDYDNTYTFKLGDDRTANPDANGKIVISSADYTEYTVTVTNSCGNSNSADVEIAINNITPTISGATFAQPGKQNAIELTVPTGITAQWSVSPAADLSETEGNSTMFSAETNGTYTITATNGTCSDTHVVTVADAFYIWVRNAKEGETAYKNFYYPNENSEAVRGGEMFYAECDALPTKDNYTTYNRGGRKADIVNDDCDGYTWYGFKASADVIAGTKYFYVHATNDKGLNGCHTHTKPQKLALTGDIYYTLGDNGSCYDGWAVNKASAPYSGPVIKSTDADFNKNNFADFAALYVTDCSGKEIDGYQWYKGNDEYVSKCDYVTKDGTVQGDAGKTNNIRPTEAGNYSCKVTYKDGSSKTSEAFPVEATSGTTYTDFKSNLPVIMVNTGSTNFPSCPVANETASKHAEEMKEKLSVDVRILSDGNIVYDRKARMAYRGSSSLNFLKKSYAFCPGDANCGDAKKGADYVKTAKLNMLGIGDAADKDWVLYAAAADPSMLRNRMVFETYQAMRPGEWGVKSRYVELIINGEYKGVYLMMDKITQNKKRVNVEWDVKDETKRGFILKFDKTDVVDRSKDYPDGDEKTFLSKYSGKHDIGTYDATNDQAFEIEYPEKEDIEDDGGNWYDVINFIQGMINNFETALSAGEYQKVQQIIDYESWADWFILSEYAKNVDAFRASCVFVYDGTKLKATPLWDQELSFNNQSVHANRYPGDTNNKGCENVTGLLIKNDRVYSDSFAAPFWFTGKLAGGKGTEKLAAKTFTGALLNDPCFVQMVKNRWEAHKSGALSNASLTALITNYEKELTSAVRTREANFWNGKSRNTLSCSWNSNTTGYYDDTYADAKADITAWISDAAASGSTGRRAGLSTAIDALEGTGLDIAIKPASIQTTPWVPVVIQVQNETGYEYTLTYTDGELDKQPNIIIEKSGDTYKYHIPRPAAWPAGNEQKEGERADLNYGIKATLQVGEGNNQCGSSAELPSATATITLQDEPNETCQ